MSIIFHGDLVPFSFSFVFDNQNVNHIGNLECALSNSPINSGKAYTSIVPVQSIQEEGIKQFSALSLANNHVYDAGECSEMIDFLVKQFPNIQFFGTNNLPYAFFNVDGERTAIIGSLEKCGSRGSLLFREENVLDLIRSLRNDFQKIYIYPHWGKESEYTRYPNPRQIKLAHKWIDAGADGVFGHHSHVFQGYEEYHGKPIFYSLGNFFFPHPEGNLYSGTDLGMSLEITPSTGWYHPSFHFYDISGLYPLQNDNEAYTTLYRISENISAMNYVLWGRKIGSFYIKKNMASWKKRIWKQFPLNFLKFLVWNILPLTLWFRICSVISHRTDTND